MCAPALLPRSVSTLSTIQSASRSPTTLITSVTASNYDGGPGTPFLGAYKDIRATRDHSYHGCYTEAASVGKTPPRLGGQRTEPQLQPWLVFTCGGMGVGRAMHWGGCRSRVSFRSRTSSTSTDHFKSVLPSGNLLWPTRRKGRRHPCGSRCHKESCYLQELALEEALRRRQNCWVDGSLRNGVWFIGVFADIRERFPDYRVAIIAVRASLDVVLQRVESRAKATGRSVPESLVHGSLDAVDRSVSVLARRPTSPRCSARVRAYPGQGDDHRPIGGVGGAQAALCAHATTAHEFPTSLAPIAIVRLSPPDGHDALRLELLSSARRRTRRAQGHPHLRGHLLLRFLRRPRPAAAARLVLDPECPLAALSDNQRTQAAVPADAATVARFRVVGSAHRRSMGSRSPSEALPTLTTQGAFGSRALRRSRSLEVSRRPSKAIGRRQAAPPPRRSTHGDRTAHRVWAAGGAQRGEAAEIPISRWDAVLPAHRQYEAGARRVAWLMAYEKLRGRMIATGGGFVYELQAANGREYVLFPMLAD